jgi:hypothetical protein
MWLGAFGFTQAVEMPIYWFAHRRTRGRALRLLKCFGASALTHPIVWFVIPRAWSGSYWGMVAIAEAFAVIAESIYLDQLRVRWPIFWSLGANTASCGLGFVIYAALGWI